MESDGRVLRWEACYNVRDLGGCPLRNGGETAWRAVVRADTLCRLTPRGRAAVLEYGVRTVVDLRHAHEREAQPHPFAEDDGDGCRYVHVPLINPATDASLRDSGSAGASYTRIVDGCPAEFAAAVRAVASAPKGGVVVHCAAGKDRTGLVVAILLALAGVPEEVIADDYVLTDVGLAPLYEEWAGQSDPAERERRKRQMVSRPEAILMTLSHLASRYGGVEGYLEAAGVRAEDLEQVRTRMRA